MQKRLPISVWIFALSTILIGIAVITGWYIHNDFLLMIFSGNIRMKFNAALCLIVASAGVLTAWRGQFSFRFKVVSYVCAVIVTLIGVLTLFEYLSGISLNIDQRFVFDNQSAAPDFFPGRMSIVASIQFILIGICLLLMYRKKTAIFQFYCLSVILAVSSLMLISFSITRDIPGFIPMAIHLAIGFIALTGAIWFAQPGLQESVLFERKMQTSFIFIAVLMLTLLFLSIHSNKRRLASSRIVGHTAEVLTQINKIHFLIKELGAHSNTADSGAIESEIYQATLSLKQMTSDNPVQQVRIDSLLLFMGKVFNNQSSFGNYQHLVAAILAIQAEENNLLEKRQSREEKEIIFSNFTIYIFLTVMFLLLIIVFFSIRSNNRKRRRSEHRFRELLDAAPDAKVIVNEAGMIQLVNREAEEQFGYSRNEMIGQPIGTIIPDAMWYQHVHHLKTYMEKTGGRQMSAGLELFGLRKDHTQFPIEIRLSEINTDEGAWILAAIRNISRRKKMENDLRRAYADQEAFSYSVSHDLRAPLRAVSGFAKILENEYGDRLDEEAKRLMVIIRSNSEQMGKLIDDLLAFFRMGRKDLVKVIVNTSQLVASVIKEIEMYIPEGQQPVRWDVAALPDVYADPASLRQVWANLIGNAVKYSKKEQDPFVQIGTYREGPQTVFFVKDNGVGFDEKYSEKLFKVFQRLHSAQDFDGTGVGLAIAEKVISKHGGNIWARSEPGKGASFYFSLPDQ